MSQGDGAQPPALRGKRFGRYVLLERIGRGGMAEIHRAVAHGPGGFQRQFVIKRIRKEKADARDFVDMFVNEARISALFDHPNIVQVYEFGEVEGDYYLAMEYLRGHDLLALMTNLLGNQRSLPVPVASFIAAEVALGLSYAHALQSDGEPLGIVHRDVTPSNIMLLNTGGVKLLDFGIARAGMRMRSTTPVGGLIKGKLSYLAPEQVRGHEVDPRTDVWALGVVLWEILVGHRLFWHQNDLEVMRNVLHKPVPGPSTVRPDVPAALDRVVLRALERDPAQRFQSAQDMADALQALPLSIGRSREILSTLLTDVFGTGSLDAGPLPDDTALTLPAPPTVPTAGAGALLAALAEDDPTPVNTPVESSGFATEGDYSVVSSVRPMPTLRAPWPGAVKWLVAGVGLALLMTAGGIGWYRWQTESAPPVVATSTVPSPSGQTPARSAAVVWPVPEQTIDEAAPIAAPHTRNADAFVPPDAPAPQIVTDEEDEQEMAPRSLRTQIRRGGRARPRDRAPAGAVLSSGLVEARARGLVAAAEGRAEQARVALQTVIKAGVADAQVYASLAGVEFEVGNYQRARALGLRAVVLSPRTARFHVLVGDACFKMGNRAAAAAAYRKALGINPTDGGVVSRLRRVEAD